MKKGKMLCFALCLMMWLSLGLARAQTVTLAHGYTAEVPEGTAVTAETWTPEDHAQLYRIEGTYRNGEEKFRLRINYGFDYQLEKGEEYLEMNPYSSGQLWLWLETTTSLKEREALSFGRQSEQAADQSKEDGLWALLRYTKELCFKEQNEEAMKRSVEVIAEDWTPEDKLVIGYVVLGYSGGPEKAIAAVYDEKGYADLVGVSFALQDYMLSQDMRDFSWQNDVIYEPPQGGYGFEFLSPFAMSNLGDDPAFRYMCQLIEGMNGEAEPSSGEKADGEAGQALPASSTVFFDNYEYNWLRGAIIKQFEEENEMEYDVLTVPVADGRYTIEMAQPQWSHSLEPKRVDLSLGSVTGVACAGVNRELGSVSSYDAIYEYMPLPENFPQGIEYLPDAEYLEMIELALDRLGEEFAGMFNAMLNDQDKRTGGDGERYAFTHEFMKAHHQEVEEEIRELSVGHWTSSAYQKNLETKDQLIELCEYWNVFDESSMQRDYLIDGRRWLEVSSIPISGRRGGKSQCAIFDGALHFASGLVDLSTLTLAE